MKTELFAILDMSGSMSSLRDDAIGGFNRFLADQKAAPGEARITTVLFDSETLMRYQRLYEAIPVSEAPELTEREYAPSGGTPLLDAVGRTLTEQSARVLKENWAEKAVCLIITDGAENMSREYSSNVVRQLVKSLEDRGWSFVYLAANVDGFAAAGQLGVKQQSVAMYAATSAGTADAYAAASSATLSARAGGSDKVWGKGVLNVQDLEDEKKKSVQ